MTCLFLTGTAVAQTSLLAPTLGLYDTAGYSYYPIETHIYGAVQARGKTASLQRSPRESRPTRSAARARIAGPVVQVSRQQVAINFDDHLQSARQRPMPVPDSMIMDPWNVGVFR